MAWLRLLLLLSVLSASSFPAAASSSPFSSSPSARRRRLVSARNPNIETFFPSDAVPAFSNPPAPPPPLASVPLFAPRRSSKGSVAAAVVATAAGTFVVSGLFFFALHWFVFKQRGVENDYDQGNKVRDEGGGGGAAARRNPYRPSPVNGMLKAVVVDEDGLDVLYWRKLEDGDPKRCAHCRQVIGEAAGGGEEGRNGSGRSEALSARRPHREYKRPVQEAPLLMDDSLSSSDRMTVVLDMVEDRSSVSSVAASTRASVEAVVSSLPSLPLPPGRRGSKTPSPASPSSSLPPPPAAVRPSPPPSSSAVASPPKPPSAPPPPPPPAAAKSVPAPPAPPPPRPVAGGNKPPGPPPAPPPAPGGARSGPSPFRPPGIPRSNSKSTGEESTKAPAKLKPLHWDKMNTVHAQHSMIWDKIGGGSFRVDDDMMEVLFGYVAGRKSPKNSSSASENPFGSAAGGAPTQICLLDPRKSQNTAIVLKSLAVTRREVMDALVDGHGLSSDTLEKLSKLAPSKEEEDSIVRFSGNPSSLADAECFLFHLLRDLPSAFARVETMLFKASYEPEVVHLRAALQSLEAACEELRRRGLFWKMLEAVLKAGNRMNAGTARGNAQAFNLTSLRKLSDVRSTDGKTTLLHFVVESVVRNEGKRCVVNRIHSFGRSASRSAAAAAGFSSSPSPGAAPTRGEKEMEYLTLGLPVVGGLSVEFANVKKAAGIDHDALASTCPALDTRAARARRVLAACGGGDGGGGFAGEIGGFLERAEEELKALREEQARVLELVKKTTEYYMLGAAQDKSASPLQLFVIVKDFLVMVDQACVDIARSVQQQKRKAALSGAASPKTPEKRAPTRFPNLPERFMSENSRSSSSGDSGSNSESEEEGL